MEEALEAYTSSAAFAGYAEDRLGTLQPGMLADLAVFDRNLLAVDRVEIEEARVDLTVVDGRVVFEREGVVGNGDG